MDEETLWLYFRAIFHVVKRKVKAVCSQSPDKRFLSPCPKDHYQRSHYLCTPPLKAIRENLFFGGIVGGMGTLAVACVPKGLGKTTACLLHMEERMKKGHNCLCFSPVVEESYSGSYCQAMLSLLGLGFLNQLPQREFEAMCSLVGSLGEVLDNYEAEKKEAILYLDGFFMKQNDEEDNLLLQSLARLAYEKPVMVVVLASTPELADHVLRTTRSAPLVRPMVNLREARRVFGRDYRRPDRNDPDFRIYWDKSLPMRWETNHLIQALAVHPSRLPWSATLEEQVRAYLDELPIGTRYAMSPERLLRDQIFLFLKGEFLNRLFENHTPPAAIGGAAASLKNLFCGIFVDCSIP